MLDRRSDADRPADVVDGHDCLARCDARPFRRPGLARGARMPGFHAMSGQAINPGDAVYKPTSRPTPINAEAMIPACVVLDAATL